MDELFGLPEDSDADDEGTEEEFVPDPTTVAFLDQEAAAFGEIVDEFEELYGFRHECRCDKDYTEGKVGEVTECFAGMVVEALQTCAQLNYENRQLKALTEELMKVQEEITKHSVEFLDNPETGDNEG